MTTEFYEKTMQGLECCIKKQHSICPYSEQNGGQEIICLNCYQALLADAIVLIETQAAQIKTRDDSLDKAHQEIKWLREMLKDEKMVKPCLDYDGRDVYRCGKCGCAFFHPTGTQADEDEKAFIQFCKHCGKKVNWDG